MKTFATTKTEDKRDPFDGFEEALKNDLNQMYLVGFHHALAWAWAFLPPEAQMGAKKLKIFNQKLLDDSMTVTGG